MADAVHSIIDIEIRSSGVDKATQSLNRLADAQDGVVVATDRATKVRERSESTIDRLARRYDEAYKAQRQLEQAQKDLDRARAAGLGGTRAFQTALAGVEKAHRLNSAAVNDNATSIGLNRVQMLESIHVAKSFADQVIAGQSPLRALAVEGGRIAQIFSLGSGGAGATMRAFGGIAVSALTSPITAAVGLTAAIAGISVAGIKASESLAKLGEQSRATGLSANTLTGAKIVGAKAGLTSEQSVGALENASRQFEAFGRNSGPTKDILEKIDKGFLKVADGARSASEWIDRIEQKIRSLPTAQGLELSKALFGEDAGRKLFEDIQSGSASMASLRDAAAAAGANFDVSAANAEKMKREIAEADQIASTRLLATFGDLANPVLVMERAWANMKLGILDVDRSARQLRDTLRFNAGQALGEHGEAASAVFARMRGARAFGGADPFAGKSFSDVDPLVNLFTQGKSPRTVGQDRALFETTKKGRSTAAGGGASSADRFASIQKDLENQISLLQSVGDEHDKIALKIKIEAEQQKLGTNATQERKDRVAELVTRLDKLQKSEKAATGQGEQLADTMKRVGDTASQSFESFANDLLKGESAGKALSSILQQIERDAVSVASKSLSSSLFGSGNSGDGLLGGLIKGGLSAFGLGGGSSGYFSSPLFSGSSFKFSFADGGVMTSAGPLPLNRYAGGGVANSPQLALFGEGRRPEAYVPLPDGRSIPVAMKSPLPTAAAAGGAPNIAIHNYAAGVEVTPQMTPQGVAFIIRSALDGYSKNLPSILSDIQKRNNRS